MAANIRLHVTGGSLHIWRAVRRVVRVDDLHHGLAMIYLTQFICWTNLIAGEEEQCIAITCECIDRGKHALEICIVVGCGWVVTIERVEWAVHVQREVDASTVERSHTLIVICRVVDCVHSDRVDPELLKFCNIALASCRRVRM